MTLVLAFGGKKDLDDDYQSATLLDFGDVERVCKLPPYLDPPSTANARGRISTYMDDLLYVCGGILSNGYNQKSCYYYDNR